MSTKLKEELKKVKTKENAPIESLVDSVKSLLIGYSSEQDEILKQAGLSSNPVESRLTEDYKRTKASEEVYKAESFTGTQIKELCNKYNLKMLPTTYYKGAVPADTADYLKEFCDKNKLAITNRELFMLAPVEMFNTKTVPDIQKDPILFYRTYKQYNNQEAAEKDVFSQVHNWGDDFKESRKYWFLTDKLEHKGDDFSNNAKFTAYKVVCFIFLIALLTGFTVFIGIMCFVLFIWTLMFLFSMSIELKNDEKWNSEEILS